MARSTRAIKACAEWLSYCLKIGWKRDQLDALQAVWWKYHDDEGHLTDGKETHE